MLKKIGKYTYRMECRIMNKRRWFEYHCYEGEDSADAELWHHTHQQVDVISEPTLVEEMDDGHSIYTYSVKFDDGLEYDVFDDELLDSPAEFERPYYISTPIE